MSAIKVYYVTVVRNLVWYIHTVTGTWKARSVYGKSCINNDEKFKKVKNKNDNKNRKIKLQTIHLQRY